MAITNYTELQADIIDWLNRATDTNLVAKVPTFIGLAETELNSILRTRYQVRRVNALLNEEIEWLPLDFEQPLAVRLKFNDNSSSRRFMNLKYVTSTQLPQYENVQGADYPCVYTIFGHAIQFAPAPKAPTAEQISEGTATEFEIFYYAALDPLSDTNPDNEILTHYPNVYLYGALKQSAPYIKDQNALMQWQTLYAEAVAQANKAGMDQMMEAPARNAAPIQAV